jgi:hypothetical protein
MPTIAECQRLRNPLRDQLELLDYDIRTAVTRGLSDVAPNGEDDVLFMNASVTVLLSIAARIYQRSLESEAGATEESFMMSAQDAIEWAKTRYLRYNVAGES